MKEINYAAVLVVVVGSFMGEAFATDRFFNDISAESPSKRYKAEAKSPDNAQKRGHRAFQSSFVYRLHDASTKQVLWTRRQAKEASPVDIFVSDTGWTVIRTAWDELIAVDLAGHDRCRIGLLTEGFTKEERTNYVHNTTAGPMWSGYSLWYFLDVDGQHVFVVRPWWGRRVVVSMETGKLLEETPGISNGAATYERNYVLTELAKGVDTRKQWEKEECCEAVWPILNASYLAGRMNVTEAISSLERLQDSSHSGSSTSGGLGMMDRFDGEVNPHSYETFTLRQVVQLSLRRLGKTPRPLAANQFDVQYEVYKKNHPYIPKPTTIPRASNAGNVKTGMKAEQVLDLVGGPDFVEYDTWEYDMDANPPFSLILKWDARKVIDVERKTPALWKEGVVRDEQILR
jgi:hypothetical protein